MPAEVTVIESKLDATLQASVAKNELTIEPVPVVIECGDQLGAIDRVRQLIEAIGGEVHYSLQRLNMLVAWIPGVAAMDIAKSDDIVMIGMQEEFQVAV